MNTVIVACALTGLVTADPEPVKPSPERIKELVKKLEEPTRHYTDPKEGPPEGKPPLFGYRWHAPEFRELRLAGDAAVPALLELLEDKSKPGQARAQAATVLIDRLVGNKVKPEMKIIAAVNAALKEEDPALRWGVLVWLWGHGLAMHSVHWETLKRVAAEAKLKNEPPIEYGAIDLLKRWPPPEERSFTPAVMDAFLPQVIAALADEHPEVAAKAAGVIHSFGRPKSGVPELLTVLKRKEPEVRASAVLALGRVGKDDPDALKAVLEELNHPERYKDHYHYQSIIGAVGGFGPKAKDAVPVLIKVIENSEWKRHEHTSLYDAAIDSLGEIGPDAKEAVPAILKYADTVRLQPELIAALDKIDPEAGKQARAIQKRKEDEFKKWVESLQNPPQPNPLPPVAPPIKP